jgi:hypothetical protein
MKPTTIETTRRGYRVGDDNEYVATFNERPSDEDVEAAQIQHGYHPGGYGGPSEVRRTKMNDGTWTVRWRSFASCD